MATRIVGREIVGTVALTTAAARLVDLIEAQLSITVQDSFRSMILQPSAEIAVGDASLGTTVGGVVQAGLSLPGGDSIANVADLNTVPVGSVYVAAATGTPTLSFQLIPY
jgi:hypothetical protein